MNPAPSGLKIAGFGELVKKLGMDEKLEFCGEPRITYISNWNDNQISRKGLWGTVPLGGIRPAGNRNLVYASRAP